MAAARGLARPVVDARQIFRCVQALSFFHKEKGNGMTAHPPSRAGVEAQLRSSELFGSFSKKALAALLDNAAMLSLGRGKAVYRQGDDATDVCVLLQGGVKLCAETRGFRPKVLEFIHPVGVFGLFDILGDRIRDLSAFTLSQSEILRVDGQYFRRQLERDAGLSLNLLKAWGVRFREFSTWCFRYNHFGAREKVAAYLLSLDSSNAAARERKVNPTRRDIASLLGITPETLSRELSYFKRRGWISTEQGGGLEVDDVPSLQSILPG